MPMILATFIYGIMCYCLVFNGHHQLMIDGHDVVITRFATGGYDIFLTCPAKSMHLEPFGLSVHAFGCFSGSRCMLLAGQVRKISYPPVAKRVINLPYDPTE